MKMTSALIVGLLATAAMVAANCYWLRFLVGKSPADLYEVFIYSIIRPGAFILLSASGATYFGLATKGGFAGKASSMFGFAICIICLALVLILDIVFLPRIRF